MAGNDFVMVQLTEFGNALADGCTLRISNGRRSFAFEPGIPIRVERSYEWLGVLRHHHTPEGYPLCELVSTPSSVLASVPAQETH